MDNMKSRTPSYEKHFLAHTDFTAGGRRNTYPHKRTFDWNLLFLKQSWGTKPMARKTNDQKNDDIKRKKTATHVKHTSGGSRTQHDRLLQPNNLFSIPENEVFTSSDRLTNHQHNFRKTGTSTCRTRRSSSITSCDTCTLPSFSSSTSPLAINTTDSSRATSSLANSVIQQSAHGKDLRSATFAKSLHKQDGRPFSFPLLSSFNNDRPKHIANFLSKLDSQTTACAVRARLRSPLYRPQQSQTYPTIFRSNLTQLPKPKLFNPKYHGEITRPIMVHSFKYKQPLKRTTTSSNWKIAENTGNKWTTYQNPI